MNNDIHIDDNDTLQICHKAVDAYEIKSISLHDLYEHFIKKMQHDGMLTINDD